MKILPPVTVIRRLLDQMHTPQRALFGFSIMLGCITVGLFAIGLIMQRDAALHDARRSALSFVNIISEHTSQTFEAADRVLREASVVRSDFNAGRSADSGVLKLELQRLLRTSHLIVALGWTDARGNLQAHTYDHDPPRPNLSDLPQFVAQQATGANEFYISPPYKTAAGEWTSAISRRLTDADGNFAGIVTARINTGYFNSIYRSLNLGMGGRVILIHRDSHMILAREPSTPNLVGISFGNQSTELDRRIAESSSGVYESLSKFDGLSRIVAYKAVPDLPLVVMVTLSTSDVLSPWYRQLMATGAATALVLLLVAVGTRLLIGQAKRVGEQRELLTTTLNSLDQGLLMVDADKKIKIYNRRALDLLDLPEQLLKSNPTADAVLQYQQSRGEFDFASDAARQGIPLQLDAAGTYTYERERPNGLAIRVRSTGLANGGVVRTYTDVTTRNATRLALEREKERAEAANRAKSDFLATMSHELRTPLTAVIGASDYLLAGERSPAELRHFLAIQRDAGKGLLSIINDILDFSRIEAGQLDLQRAPISLRELARECITIVSHEATSKNLSLTTEIDPAIPQAVEGDEGRLRQVLLNLLSNAVKFTDTGAVTLRISADASSADAYRFAVSDTGIGIASDQLLRIFDRFTQADNSKSRRFGGAGLGLAISKRLVELMGGVIEVESVPGLGSTFSIVLRLNAAGAVPEKHTQEASPILGFSVLLAEDTASSRLLIATVLTRYGCEVVSVATGRDAVEAALRKDFDVILMDIQMPDMDGLEAARAIRAQIPAVAIIALTADAVATRESCLAAGMDACVMKPVKWDLLVDVMRDKVRKTSHPPARIKLQPMASHGLEALRGKLGDESVCRLLTLFEHEATTCFEDAPEAERLADEAHSLAGSAGMLGLDGLEAACRALMEKLAESAPFTVELSACRRERDAALRIMRAWAESSIANGRSGSEPTVRRSAGQLFS